MARAGWTRARPPATRRAGDPTGGREPGDHDRSGNDRSRLAAQRVAGVDGRRRTRADEPWSPGEEQRPAAGGCRQFGGRARALWRDPPPESLSTVPRQHPQSAAGIVGAPGYGDVLMATGLRSPSPLTASLTVQISEAEGRLRNRRRLVRVRGAALGRTLHQRITAPAMLLWAGGLGFIVGELIQRPTPQSRSTDRSPDSSYSFLETALNLIRLVTWARTLFAALPVRVRSLPLH